MDPMESGYENPTQLCLDCLGPRRSALWLRLYSLPLEASTSLHIASFLHNDLCRTWRRAYVTTICLQVREPPFHLLIWRNSGEAAVLRGEREICR